LDKYLRYKGYKFVRYADDFSVYRTSKSRSRKIGNEIYLFLRDKLDLPINREKRGIRRPNTYKILGHSFVPNYKKGMKGKYQIVVNKKSRQALKRKLKYITKKTLPMSITERLKELKLIYRGWLNNFRLANIESKLKKLDEWLRNRLRNCIWSDWKKPERKRKNLIRLGIEQGQAYAWSRTRMGGWAVAQSPMLKTTITVERLKHKGYEQMLNIRVTSKCWTTTIRSSSDIMNRRIREPYVRWCERRTLLANAGRAVYSISTSYFLLVFSISQIRFHLRL